MKLENKKDRKEFLLQILPDVRYNLLLEKHSANK
jgi:hypothetical protein